MIYTKVDANSPVIDRAVVMTQDAIYYDGVLEYSLKYRESYHTCHLFRYHPFTTVLCHG